MDFLVEVYVWKSHPSKFILHTNAKLVFLTSEINLKTWAKQQPWKETCPIPVPLAIILGSEKSAFKILRPLRNTDAQMSYVVVKFCSDRRRNIFNYYNKIVVD